jgi:hypothetical protein
MGKTPNVLELTKFHAGISVGIPNGSRQGSFIVGSRPMPLSGTTYDPDTLAMLYRALDEAIRQAIPDIDTLSSASQQAIREKIARSLIQAYED